MDYSRHLDLIGTHAPLSPSSPSWLKYDDAKLRDYFINLQAKQRGTRLHDLACKLIQEHVNLPRKQRTLNSYVNDAIGFGMSPEQVLFYSYNCYGTADAILFENGKLRIHDLKTGKSPAHIEQLEIYAALYCLEHGIVPQDISTELRIYQNDDVLKVAMNSDLLETRMRQIVHCDQIYEETKRDSGL